jgi:murein L,D-transpeptidase YcbB/YkuD
MTMNIPVSIRRSAWLLALILVVAPVLARADGRADDRTPLGEVAGRLEQALAKYRAIERAGGWPAIGDGVQLRPGTRDPRVVQLRQRLAATGDYKGQAVAGEQTVASGSDDLFDLALVAAVQHFQERYGLRATGWLDPETIAEMNVPVQLRIAQLELNLRRARRLPRNLGGRYIQVNIPSAQLKLVENGRTLHVTRVVLGEEAHGTPELNSVITHIELNPWWNAPTSIVKRILIDTFKKDPSYIKDNDYLLLRRPGDNGSAVNPDAIDWDKVSYANFHYQVRQKPGPKNVLGHVVFWFASKYNVFLHDTSTPELFEDDVRYYSSGCIRVDAAVYLAMLLLRDQDNGSWTEQKIQSVIDTRVPFNIQFKHPVPVHITYFTAWADMDGVVQFRKDIYGLDHL